MPANGNDVPAPVSYTASSSVPEQSQPNQIADSAVPAAAAPGAKPATAFFAMYEEQQVMQQRGSSDIDFDRHRQGSGQHPSERQGGYGSDVTKRYDSPGQSEGSNGGSTGGSKSGFKGLLKGFTKTAADIGKKGLKAAQVGPSIQGQLDVLNVLNQ